MVLVGKDTASADRSRVGINAIIHEIHVPLMRKSVFVSQSHLGRNFLVARADTFAFPAEADVFQNGALVGVPVEIQRIKGDKSGQQSSPRTRDPATDQISFGDERAADAPVNARVNLGKFEIEPGKVCGRLRRHHRGLSRRGGLGFGVKILL